MIENTFKGLKTLKTVNYNNARVLGDHTRFGTPDYNEQKLKIMREKYSLDDVIRPGKNDWEKILLLRKWVKSRWIHGYSPIPEGGSALDILEAAEKGSLFACGVYSSVFQQCCAVLGFPARLVSILRDRSDIPEPANAISTGHCISEVWINDFQKWVVVDTDMDCHYEKDGMPLNACEIRQEWLKGNEALVLQVPPRTTDDILTGDVSVRLEDSYNAARGLFGREYADRHMSKAEHLKGSWDRFTMHKNMHFYRYVVIPAGGKFYMPVDDMEGPLLLVNEYPIQRAWPDITWTSNPDDVYFTLNQTVVNLKVVDDTKGAVRLNVKLGNTTPDFCCYRVGIDSGEWETKPSEFEWILKEGKNTMSAYTVNKQGREGIRSSIGVELAYER